ncbi:FabD/lysophospholipase-like protein, partial [Neoconidiobolus thromboides FSU 785]
MLSETHKKGHNHTSSLNSLLIKQKLSQEDFVDNFIEKELAPIDSYSKVGSIKLSKLITDGFKRKNKTRTHTVSEPQIYFPLNQQVGFIQLKKEPPKRGNRPFRILAIDGGGVKGIIPASILNQLEVEAKKPIHELFDLICGTSTGAILAVMLSVPKEQGSKESKFTARDGIDLYLNKSSTIFKSSIYRRISTLAGLRTAQYDTTHKTKIFKETLGDLKMSDLLSNMLIPTFDVREGKPYFFKTSHLNDQDNINRNYSLIDVLNATTSAPTYFQPHKVEGYDSPKEYGYRSFVDGALTANSPALCGLAEAYKNYEADPEKTVLVSLGCGESSLGLNHEAIKDWGSVNWALYFPSIMLSSSVNTVDYQLRNLVPPKHYFRVQPVLPAKYGEIDNVDPKNLNYLV